MGREQKQMHGAGASGSEKMRGGGPLAFPRA